MENRREALLLPAAEVLPGWEEHAAEDAAARLEAAVKRLARKQGTQALRDLLTADAALLRQGVTPNGADRCMAAVYPEKTTALDYLPADFQEDFRELLFPDEESYEWRIVKAADRISAYVKCLEEYGFGNREFLTAQENVRASVSQMNMPEAEDFMREFAPSFMLPLDALN